MDESGGVAWTIVAHTPEFVDSLQQTGVGFPFAGSFDSESLTSEELHLADRRMDDDMGFVLFRDILSPTDHPQGKTGGDPNRPQEVGAASGNRSGQEESLGLKGREVE